MDMETLSLSLRLNLEHGSAILFVSSLIRTSATLAHVNAVRFLDIYQVTQALNTVLTNQKQLSEMRRSWQKVDFESVRNQSALVCNCRHEELVQLLEVDFVTMMDSLSKTAEPVREVMAWADKCCERLMGQRVGAGDDRGTLSSRSVLIRWGYVTSQVMRDLVRITMIVHFSPFIICHQTIRSDPAFGAFQIMKLFLECVGPI
jgi:regulatory factor X